MGPSGAEPAVPGIWWTHEATPSQWVALEMFLARSDVAPACLEPADFMWMAEVLLPTGVLVQLYKHTRTRRYLMLGDDELAYRFSNGCYSRHALIGDAIDGLELLR